MAGIEAWMLKQAQGYERDPHFTRLALERRAEYVQQCRIPELVEGLTSFCWRFDEEDNQPFDKLRDTEFSLIQISRYPL
jgi:hypothetical protein